MSLLWWHGGIWNITLYFFLPKKKNGVLIIHGGTLFDYVFVINRKMSVKQRTHFILRQYLTGLLNLIDECTENEDPQLIIRGTSYIMNRKTISKMGFKIIETDFIERMIILFNYINILLSYSIAKGKLSFPKIISQTITFEATLEELINKKSYILELNKKLQKFSWSFLDAPRIPTSKYPDRRSGSDKRYAILKNIGKVRLNIAKGSTWTLTGPHFAITPYNLYWNMGKYINGMLKVLNEEESLVTNWRSWTNRKEIIRNFRK